MYARLGFSIAVHVDPEVLLVDEILAVGDASFQRRCYARIAELKAAGKTLVLVSHALDAIVDHCSECAWLDAGQIREIDSPRTVVPNYLDEVRRREVARIEAAVAELHRQVPSGREGVGISSVTFADRSGAGREFNFGGNFEVRIQYHSPREHLQGAQFSLDFVREDGVVAFSSTVTQRAGETLPGSGTVVLKVPRLPLLPALYRASVSILDAASEEPYTVLSNAFPFRVMGEGAPAKGVVDLPHQWVLPAAAESARLTS
jgi:energy-coupling factor transporter ATP-binding protein EcfA2